MTVFEFPHSIAGSGGAVGYHPQIRLLPSVEQIPKAAWEEMLPGEPECWDFYRTVESVPPPGFTLSVIAAFEENRILAAAPVFGIEYRLDTPFQGKMRACSEWLNQRWPRLLTRSVMGLGSPMSDSCTIGFAPHLLPFQRRRVFSAMLSAFDGEAKFRGTSILGIKSLGRQAEQLAPSLARHGFHRVTNLPIVALPVRFRDMDHYLRSLPKKTRTYMKRKMRSLQELHIEFRTSAEDIEEQLFPLFENTRDQSRSRYGEFEDLNRDLFKRVMSELGDKACLMLCWKGDRLMGFSLVLVAPDCVIGKYIGMIYPEARELNLYFVMALKWIEMAIECGIGRIEMGATTYPTKLLFGGHLERRWLYYRCLNPWQDTLIHAFDFLLDFERNDKDLRRLSAKFQN
jgi:peptidoglycan biosynthesis/recognition FemAB-like protein